jgi:hypothetical protein
MVGIISPNTLLTTYNMVDPLHLAAQALPTELKELGKTNLVNMINKMSSLGYSNHQLYMLKKSIEWVESKDTWDTYKVMFQQEVKDIDAVRNENFLETFPELKGLFDA